MTFEQQNTFARFLPLVHSTAKQFTRRGCHFNQYYDDLYNEGALALHQAVISGDSNESFSEYARLRVRGAMLDHIRSLYWDRRMRRKNRRDGGSKVFLAYMHVDESLENFLEKFLGTGHNPEPENAFFTNSFLKLRKKEQMVLRLFFARDMNGRAIARFLGVSEPRINQIKKDAIDKLRKKMER